MFGLFDPLYLLMVSPALILALWAQSRVRANYAKAQKMPAPLSGAAAARHLLDSAGLQQVAIEPIPGELTDHYDPRHKVLRLSQGVYDKRNLAAVGIAAHEAGHAIQDAQHYAPLVVRNLAVPVAGIGSNLGIMLVFIGAMFVGGGHLFGEWMVNAGFILFGAVVFFQVVNLPVEFDASNRAKRQLVEYGIVDPGDMVYVNKVLNAAAWTYVAATLQAIMILIYLIIRFGGRRS